MWREQVYSGTLRPATADRGVTGGYLSLLLDHLNATTPSAPRLSNIFDVNIIDTGLYLGDKYTAKCKRFLKQHNFTHVLNASEGLDMYQVDTSQAYYSDIGIKYFGIRGHDRPSWNISVYFEDAAKFIDDAIRSGGKVLVHCVVGISRSATLVIAYLMICRRMSAPEALTFTFRRRRVFPNMGFLHHLAQLDAVLQKRSCIRRLTHTTTF